MPYRYDSRDKEQFVRDIKARTMEERVLFLTWLDLIEAETGKLLSYKDKGCGRSGKLLEQEDVSLEPDFEVEEYGKIEVKFAKSMLREFFHLKVSHVKYYHENEVTVLMVNGADEDIPEFTMLKPPIFERIQNECKVIPFTGFGGKMAFKIPIDWFIWRPLV